MSKDKHPFFLFLIAVMIIPLIILSLAIFSKQATGPYWLGPNFDPSYLYLVNSLYLVDGHTPYFVDHPGITLQILGALVIKALSIGKAPGQIIDQVFSDPELYLHVIYYTMLSFYIITLLFIGLYSFMRFKNLIFSLLLQTSSFLLFTLKSYINGGYVLPVIANVNSDTFILPVSNLYILCLLMLFYELSQKEENANKKKITSLSILMGITCGLGIATKLTFIPMLLGPLVLLPKLKSQLLFFIVFLISWLVIISPILSRYQEMYNWITPIAQGHIGANDLTSFLMSLKWLITDHSLLFFSALFCLGLTVLKKFLQRKGRTHKTIDAQQENKHLVINTFLLIISILILGQFVFIAKNAGPQYMSPALNMFGVLAGFFYLVWEKDNLRKRRWGMYMIPFILISLGFVAIHYQYQLRKVNKEIYAFSQNIYKQNKNCVVFGYYRSSSMLTAIEWAQAHGNLKIYSKFLNEKYPNAFFYNRWHRTFHNFDKNVFLRQVLSPNKCGLLYGSPFDFEGFIKVEKIGENHSEKLYKIISTNLDDAHMAYLTALALESQKKYVAAYVFALRAKMLGVPSLEAYLKKLESLIKK